VIDMLRGTERQLKNLKNRQPGDHRQHL
jgi:hypothetical protein